MKQLIILEGPDCTGKTTLAKYLARNLGAIYVKCNGAMSGIHAPAHFDNVLDSAKFNAGHELTTIIDRHWPSEALYGPIFDRPGLTVEQCTHFDSRVKSMGGIYVLTKRSDVIQAHAKERDDEHPYDDARFTQVVEAYDKFRDEVMGERDDVIVYNYNMYAHQLHKVLEMVRSM